MRCQDCRQAISALLDGEDDPGEATAVDEHTATCPDCRSFLDRAAQVTRLARTGLAEPGPDLVAAVLAAAPTRRERRADAVRLALGAVGLAQGALAVSGIATAGTFAMHDAMEVGGASAMHVAHESAAWNLALAVGFLWAATAAPRLSGLLPVIGSFVAVLAGLSALDLIAGRVDPGRILGHGLVVLGLVLLMVLRRRDRREGDGALVGLPPDAPRTERRALWTGRIRRPAALRQDSRPTARRAA
ncbi:zf-HC2 domain-containing protein [Pseudonocardia xinjiangensis]|uniref:zf-HC2 domain-containing protein n=1 Tax=Pseudonocardia xinjiangensis TaxID=75289 RepID=UPI003D8D4BDD